MATQTSIQWLKQYMLLVAIPATVFPSAAFAAQEGARLILRPHCEEKQTTNPEGAIGGGLEDLSSDLFVNFTGTSNASGCPLFSIRDPLTRETPVLKKDDTLDMDLVLIQDDNLPIHRVRAWLAYDPEILEGDLLEVRKDFPESAPGEKDFVSAEGYIKIDISTSQPQTTGSKEIVIARIRMRVKEHTAPSTPISFYDVSQALEGHTMVISGEGPDARNILFPELGSLLVRLEGENAVIQEPESPPLKPAPPESPKTSEFVQKISHPLPQPNASKTLGQRPPSPVATTPFTLLQVQNIAVTSEGTNIFLGWDPLSTPDLIGYNIYYASRSGEYIHKRSLDAVSTSTTIRDLPTGVKYFLSVRGVNRAQQESAFSREVAVTVGSPATSTSPLAARLIPKAPPALRTPLSVGTVPGQTGISSWILGTIIGVALLGTIFAIRKQLLLS